MGHFIQSFSKNLTLCSWTGLHCYCIWRGIFQSGAHQRKNDSPASGATLIQSSRSPSPLSLPHADEYSKLTVPKGMSRYSHGLLQIEEIVAPRVRRTNSVDPSRGPFRDLWSDGYLWLLNYLTHETIGKRRLLPKVWGWGCLSSVLSNPVQSSPGKV